MTNIPVTVAVGDYDRVRPLATGSVQIDGVDPVFSLLYPEEMFFRAFRFADFDVTELSLSSYVVRLARGDCPYVAIPVFPSRAFRHNAIFIRNDRGITKPEDLRGKRIGLPEYQLTANVWVRYILEQDYGVAPSDIEWVRGGYEVPGRSEKIPLQLPPTVRVAEAPPGKTLSRMLAEGEIDGLIGPRAPSPFDAGHPAISWLFPDPGAAALAWYERTKIFPIMHVIGVRRSLVERYPFLAGSLTKAFDASKRMALEALTDTSAPKVTLPLLDESLRRARRLMGHDFWPYGLEPNRTTLQAFLAAHHGQGLSARQLAPEELFHPSSLESFAL
ncbi:MAG: ABC transporter substrate-binding protein [Rhodopseudomonas sp.]|nr:ABC transporter substrate-binding protein [Rhodopseudomonas sp.]